MYDISCILGNVLGGTSYNEPSTVGGELDVLTSTPYFTYTRQCSIKEVSICIGRVNNDNVDIRCMGSGDMGIIIIIIILFLHKHGKTNRK